MSYKAYITKIENVRKHPNADRLQLGECFGNTVCVDLSYKNNQIGIYFPTDGQLSEEFAKKNNLLRIKDENGENVGGYMDPRKRNIKTIKLRGEKSDGLFLPIESLTSFGDISKLKVGDIITTFNGHEICCKYVPKINNNNKVKFNNSKKIIKKTLSPLFKKHVDTEQLAYNLSVFRPGDEIEISLKIHGTSQRTAYLPVAKKYKKSIIDRLFRREGKPIYNWDYISGTRKTILENYEGGYYGDNNFRKPHHDFFVGKLHKGETVYYEVCGYTDKGKTIMPSGKVPKEYQKTYGKTMIFSYGCKESESDIYVYRMTMINEDGDVVEYTPDFMRYRCAQMGIKTVPLFEKLIIPKDVEDCGKYVKEKAEKYYEGIDPIGRTHVREGVVVRIVNRPSFTALKLKNFLFKCVEGLIKENAEAPDIEEAEGEKDE